MKKIFLTLILMVMLPVVVNAGTITFSKPTSISNSKYSFDIVVDDATLNYMSGNLTITNGYISNVTMYNDWVNETSNSTSFYFYNKYAKSGSYKVATIEVTMSGSSKYSVSNFVYGLYTCTKDSYGILFGEDGNVVTESVYNNTCLLSTDASLKSLSSSVGSLNPSFNASTLRYNMQVDSSVSSVTFDAVANDSGATISGDTVCSIKSTLNICTITVTSAKGNTTKYVIGVYKDSNGSSSYDTSITNFQVHNATLMEEFSEDKTTYNIKIDDNVSSFYFTFDTNDGNTHHTTDVCSANASTCKVTIKLANTGKTVTYTFNVINNSSNNTSTDSNSSSSSNNTSSSKSSSSKSTTSSSSSNSTNSTNSSNSTNNSSNTSEEESNEVLNEEDIEIIIDPTEVDPISDDSEDEIINMEEETEVSENNDIKLPFNISVSQNTFLTVIGFIIFALGILLGNLITKRKNK